MAKTRVKCCVCTNEVSGKCLVKNVTVKLKKKRSCDDFVFTPEKVKVHMAKPKVVMRPDDYWDKNLRKERRRKAMEEMKRQEANMNGVRTAGPDILSRFRSSATVGEA